MNREEAAAIYKRHVIDVVTNDVRASAYECVLNAFLEAGNMTSAEDARLIGDCQRELRAIRKALCDIAEYAGAGEQGAMVPVTTIVARVKDALDENASNTAGHITDQVNAEEEAREWQTIAQHYCDVTKILGGMLERAWNE